MTASRHTYLPVAGVPNEISFHPFPGVKGLVYVNGHGIGRIWEIGPQQTLYVPGTWLKKGENEVLVFDIMGPKEAVSFGSKTPELDKLLVKKPLTHREPGQELDLEGSKPVVSSSLTPGNGWKEIWNRG